MKKYRLFVGSVPYKSTVDQLRVHFEMIGPCSVEVPLDRAGKSRGFGFVEYKTQIEYDAALEKLNGSDFLGRQLRVTEAEDPEERRGSGERRGRDSQTFADR